MKYKKGMSGNPHGRPKRNETDELEKLETLLKERLKEYNYDYKKILNMDIHGLAGRSLLTGRIQATKNTLKYIKLRIKLLKEDKG